MLHSLSANSASVRSSTSLLLRVKTGDGEAWRRLAYLYGPLVYRWARKAGLQPSDAQDVVQNVFLAVASSIGHFRRNRPGDSFRGWLYTVCRRKILDHFRERGERTLAAGGSAHHQQLQQLATPEPDSQEVGEEICRLRQRALVQLRGHFEQHVWEAFNRTVVHNDRPVDVARDLGISVATVYRAKLRVLSRLRTELEGL